MKFIFQFGIILVITFAAELIHNYVPLPVPASIYGLIIMLVLLCLRIIKTDQIKDCALWLVAVMPLMFIPAGAKLMTVADQIFPIILPLIAIIFVTTVIVMAISGKITEVIIIVMQKRKENKNGK